MEMSSQGERERGEEAGTRVYPWLGMKYQVIRMDLPIGFVAIAAAIWIGSSAPKPTITPCRLDSQRAIGGILSRR